MVKNETLNVVEQVHNAVIELLRDVPQDEVAAYTCLIEDQAEDIFNVIKDYHSINSPHFQIIKG